MEWAGHLRAGGVEASTGDGGGGRSGTEEGLSVHLQGYISTVVSKGIASGGDPNLDVDTVEQLC